MNKEKERNQKTKSTRNKIKEINTQQKSADLENNEAIET